MPKSNEYLEYVLEQLDRFGGVTARRMFSGFGLYQHEVFFGLLFSNTLYFKVNDNNRPEYESRGMRRFQPYKDKPHLSFHYYEVPAEILENREEITAWAARSVGAAIALAQEKAAKRRTPKAKRVKRKKAKGTKVTRPKSARSARSARPASSTRIETKPTKPSEADARPAQDTLLKSTSSRTGQSQVTPTRAKSNVPTSTRKSTPRKRSPARAKR